MVFFFMFKTKTSCIFFNNFFSFCNTYLSNHFYFLDTLHTKRRRKAVKNIIYMYIYIEREPFLSLQFGRSECSQMSLESFLYNKIFYSHIQSLYDISIYSYLVTRFGEYILLHTFVLYLYIILYIHVDCNTLV